MRRRPRSEMRSRIAGRIANSELNASARREQPAAGGSVVVEDRLVSQRTGGRASTRADEAADAVRRWGGRLGQRLRAHPVQSSNRPGWRSLGTDGPRRCDQRPDLAALDVAPSAELDALELAGARPAADRRRREVDVGGLEDLGRLGQRDPVGRGAGHLSRPRPGWGLRLRAGGRGSRRSALAGSARSALGRDLGLGSPDDRQPRSGVPGRAARRVAAGPSPPARRRPSSRRRRRGPSWPSPEPLKWTVGTTNALRIASAAHRAGLGSVAVDPVDDLHPMPARACTRSRRWARDEWSSCGSRCRSVRSAVDQPRSRRMPHFGQ